LYILRIFTAPIGVFPVGAVIFGSVIDAPAKYLLFFAFFTHSHISTKIMTRSFTLLICVICAFFAFNPNIFAQAPVIGGGLVLKGNGVPVVDVQFRINEVPVSYITPSDSTGLFEVTPPSFLSDTSATVIPFFIDPHDNGVTVYDVFLISRHIMGLEPLSNAYKVIAADANKSGSITTFDIVEIRKLILGIYSEYPNNDSWRFIPEKRFFDNPQNPFTEVIGGVPVVVTFGDLITAPVDTEFIAIKVGDVNLNAITGGQPETEVNSGDQLKIDILTTQFNVQTGDIIELKIAPQKNLMHQYTLQLSGFEVIDIMPSFLNFTSLVIHPNFANGHKVTACMSDSIRYTIRLRALTDGAVCDMVSFNDDITPTLAYYQNGQRVEVRERCDLVSSTDEGLTQGATLNVLPNTPNTWSTRTNINFELPTDDQVTLQVYNINGQLLYQTAGDFSKGINYIPIEAAQVGGASGQLIYTISNSTNTVTRSMTRL
jgi:large repetitive protein